MDGLRPGVDETGAHPDVSGPGRDQPPPEPGDNAIPVLIKPAGREVLRGSAIVVGLQIQRQGWLLEAVQVVNLMPSQLLCETASH